jgi:hypothetical protein
MLCSTMSASAALKRGASSVGFGKAGLYDGMARGGCGGLNVGGVRYLASGRRRQRTGNVMYSPVSSGRFGKEGGLGPTVGVHLHAQARWFVVSSRWRSDGQKGAGSGKPEPGTAGESRYGVSHLSFRCVLPTRVVDWPILENPNWLPIPYHPSHLSPHMYCPIPPSIANLQ